MRPLPLDHPVRVTEDAAPDARGIFPGLGDGGPPPVPLSTVLSPLRGSDRAGARVALEAPTRETLADLRVSYRDAGLAGPKLAAAMQAAARYIAHMRRRNPRGRTEPDHLRKAAYYAGAEALAVKVAREVEIPSFIGRSVWMAQARDLRKGAGHKYLRRVKGPNGKWRYFYKVSGGRGLGHAGEFHVGAKFAGGGGHFEIVSESGDLVEIRHDETGGTRRLDKAALSELLRKHHVEALR